MWWLVLPCRHQLRAQPRTLRAAQSKSPVKTPSPSSTSDSRSSRAELSGLDLRAVLHDAIVAHEPIDAPGIRMLTDSRTRVIG
jgi:hypothetical protein